jgi:hypothetical protein
MIVVLPVPRNLRHMVNELIKQQAFPAIKKWLLEHKNLSVQYGVQAIQASYDAKNETIRIDRFQSPGETFQGH